MWRRGFNGRGITYNTHAGIFTSTLRINLVFIYYLGQRSGTTKGAMSSSPTSRYATGTQAIPAVRRSQNYPEGLSSTPGGTVYSTTPGGKIFELK